MSDLVGNPEDRFSRVAAHLIPACSFLFQGVDDAYDMALTEFFIPYHSMVDLMCRVAVNQQILSENIINLSKYFYP